MRIAVPPFLALRFWIQYPSVATFFLFLAVCFLIFLSEFRGAQPLFEKHPWVVLAVLLALVVWAGFIEADKKNGTREIEPRAHSKAKTIENSSDISRWGDVTDFGAQFARDSSIKKSGQGT